MHYTISHVQRILAFILMICIHIFLGIWLFLLEPVVSPFFSEQTEVFLVQEEQAPVISQQTTLMQAPPEEWGLVIPKSLLAGEKTPANNSNETISLTENSELSETNIQQTTSEPTEKTIIPSPETISLTTAQKSISTGGQTLNQSSIQKPVSHKKLSLAAIGKGFLEQEPDTTYGTGFMPGKRGASLTESQIAIERYSEKLEQMVGPLFRSVFSSCPPPRTVTHAPGLAFNISPEGKLFDFCISESSGDIHYDELLITKIKELSPWGPPLPETIRAALDAKHHVITLHYH